MTTNLTTEAFFESAREAIRRDGGTRGLAELGVFDVLDDLDDDEARLALFATFRAQGRELGGAPLLGALMARPFLEGTDVPGESVALALSRRSVRRGDVLLLVGEPSVDRVLVDRPGAGAGFVPRAEIEFVPVAVSGRLPLHEIRFDPDRLEPVLSESAARAARARSLFLGRLAVVFEILGSAEGAFALALGHAEAREQFGQPIGRFQAVRHLLSWASTDLTAIEHVAARAASLDRAAPARLDAIAKALAGRNGRRACERALQVLGAIGFTTEHEHHHFHSRVLALDALLGRSTRLAAELGAWLREERVDPQIQRAFLVPRDTSPEDLRP